MICCSNHRLCFKSKDMIYVYIFIYIGVLGSKVWEIVIDCFCFHIHNTTRDYQITHFSRGLPLKCQCAHKSLVNYLSCKFLFTRYVCVCVCVCTCARVLSCSVVSDSVTPWTVAHQVPVSMVFPRQEYWNGSPFPLPGDLLDSGIKPVSPATPALAGRFFYHSTTWEA